MFSEECSSFNGLIVIFWLLLKNPQNSCEGWKKLFIFAAWKVDACLTGSIQPTQRSTFLGIKDWVRPPEVFNPRDAHLYSILLIQANIAQFTTKRSYSLLNTCYSLRRGLAFASNVMAELVPVYSGKSLEACKADDFTIVFQKAYCIVTKCKNKFW